MCRSSQYHAPLLVGMLLVLFLAAFIAPFLNTATADSHPITDLPFYGAPVGLNCGWHHACICTATPPTNGYNVHPLSPRCRQGAAPRRAGRIAVLTASSC